MAQIEGLEKKKAVKPPKKSAKKTVKAASAKKPVQITTTGNANVDAILRRINEMAASGPSPYASAEVEEGLPSDWNASGGRSIQQAKAGSEKSANPDGPSNFHKLMSALLAPGNALRGAYTEGLDENAGAFNDFKPPDISDMASGFMKGIKNEKHYSGKNLLAQLAGREDGKGRGLGTAGFLLEVAADPLNAVPLPIGKIAQGIKATRTGKGGAAGRAAEVPTGPLATADEAVPAPEMVREPLGTQREIIENETRIAKKAGRIRPSTAPDAAFGVDKARPMSLPKIVPVPKVTPKTTPPPKPLEIHEMPDAVQAKAVSDATARAISLFDSSELAAKVKPGVRMTWAEIARDPALKARVTSDPKFREWYKPILNAERIKAAAHYNGAREAEYYAAIKALDKAAPLPVAETAAKTTAKPFSKGSEQALESAVNLHLRTNGEQALTSLGQGKLRQTIANEYFKAHPNAIKWKNTKTTQKAINRLYVAAEARLLESVPLQAKARLSEVMSKLSPEDLSDPSKIARAIDAEDVQTAATKIASELPQAVQKSFVQSVLKSLEKSGNATEVVQAKYLGSPTLKFRAAEAVAKDLGYAKTPRMPLPTRQTDKTLADTAEYAARVPETLDRMFNTFPGMSHWEKASVVSAKGATQTHLSKAVDRIVKIAGRDKEGFNIAHATAIAGGTEAKASEIREVYEFLTESMKKAGVSPEEFVSRLKKHPQFFQKGRKENINPHLGFDAWKSIPVGDAHAAKLMALYAYEANNATLTSATVGHLADLFGAVGKVGGKEFEPERFKEAVAAGYRQVPGIPSLEGVVFPPDSVHRIQQILALTKPGATKDADSFMRHYDKILGLYKVGLTKYLPSHHITNHIGGVYMAWLDGLTDPRWYGRAWSVMAHQDAAVDGVAKGITKEGITTGSGHNISQVEAMALFNDMGLRPSFAGISDIASDAAELQIKSKIPLAVDKASQAREVHLRLSHFLYALSKEKGSLAEAARNAAVRVQKHHANYGDLTDFERRVMRRIIPFYTWQRKVAPTLLLQAVNNPAKIMVYPKLQQSINSHFGIEAEPGNPFPGMAGTPSFMTEGVQALYGHNAAGNQLWGGPRTPFDDVIGKFANHPLGNILDQLTPAIKAPYELNSGQAIGNSEIRTLTDKRDARDYAESNTPLLNVLVRLTRRSPSHGFAPTQDNPDEQGTNITALVNLLTAGGLRENTERMRGIAERQR